MGTRSVSLDKYRSATVSSTALHDFNYRPIRISSFDVLERGLTQEELQAQAENAVSRFDKATKIIAHCEVSRNYFVRHLFHVSSLWYATDEVKAKVLGTFLFEGPNGMVVTILYRHVAE